MTEDIEALKYPIGKHQPPTGYDSQKLNEWISVLEALPNWLDVCIENLDEAQLQTPHRPGGWTVQQVLHHLADSHMNMYIRMKFALTEDNPTIMPYDENKWAVLYDVEEVPVNISITLLHTLHRRIVAVLRKLTPQEWERTYYHPEKKSSFTMWQMAALYAWHSRHHMEHIRQLRVRMGW
ncbi:metal-dependent hydrolase [Chitinophagaceae bacterium IBVUCB1]|nr:metal-dependent hydrolase [Chitinophagaceae bacterium IBVUCB1]